MNARRAALHALVDRVPDDLVSAAEHALAELVVPPLVSVAEGAAVREGIAQHARGESTAKDEAFRRLDAAIAARRDRRP